MKKILIVAAIFALFYTFTKEQEQIVIPDNAIRFRLIASSNEIQDQALKLNIKNDLLKDIIPKLSEGKTLEQARSNIKQNIPTLKGKLNTYDMSYNVSFGKNHFPVKSYQGINYPEGNYESLVVTLGEGKGDNWWCVLFPPLCLLEAEENQTEEVEYKSFVKEVLDNYIKK